jgi:hypothetical protein
VTRILVAGWITYFTGVFLIFARLTKVGHALGLFIYWLMPALLIASCASGVYALYRSGMDRHNKY